MFHSFVLTCILLSAVDEPHGDDVDVHAAAGAVGKVCPGVDPVDVDAEAELESVDEHDDGEGDGEDDVAPAALGVVVLLQGSSFRGMELEGDLN